MGLNFNLILNVILPGLIGGSIVSALAATLVGGTVGLIAGARSHQIKRTLLSTLVGSFFGTMLIAVLPIVSQPGLSGSGYGGLSMMTMAVFLVPLGAIGGALVGCFYGLKLSRKRKKQVVLFLLIATYSVIAVVSYARISMHCIDYPWYCSGSF